MTTKITPPIRARTSPGRFVFLTDADGRFLTGDGGCLATAWTIVNEVAPSSAPAAQS